ncbi:hypothetical protein LSH36_1562g00058 [Paralvinella palmiformis]|uniref:Fibronectin type-III domain-containing protein n=1 Tax=Paralvinella palmiformis TaxID=53620 RepID=A0AAD9ISS9_9ANNE|nr:hypothetical protein LSH36_1562g00058 [Paralvinella palmiformis]
MKFVARNRVCGNHASVHYIMITLWLIVRYCLYGDDPNCAFQCHCAVDNECSGGTCPSGCDTSLPSGYTWSGPSCQIGNVGLHKSTNMTASDFYQKTYPATGALDDCTQCPVDVNCNDVTGCVSCQGSYQPDCKQKTPKNTHENLMLINKTGDIIEIGWEHINGIAVNLRRFYGYIIQYSIDLDDANYRDVGIVSYDSDPYWKIENLQINTIYYIKVTPYRKVGDLRETGKAYDTLKVKTDCSAYIVDLKEANYTHVGRVLSSIKPICNPIRKVTLFYKKKTLSNSTAIYLLPTETCTVFVAEENAEYEIKLVVEDNEGYMSSSDIFSVLVKGADNWSSQRISLIAAVVVNVILIVVIIILVTQLWKLRQKKMQHSSNNLSMMSTDQRHDNSIILQDRHDTVTSDNGIHYEDISANTEGEDIVESQYEGVSAEGHRIYQNNMISGPYEELKK